ncbi:hypothetical protein C0585_00455 [Candidatus Woesearchaeota archaeon]|nr:MAG: hypothetical protein C0585_00455 [Candidatus Woesearchaeota archaeon]
MAVKGDCFGGYASDMGGPKYKNLDNMIYVQDWESSNYGHNREDGFSLHITPTLRKEFINEYWEGMPPREKIPGTYSRPKHHSYICKISDKLYDMLEDQGGNMRINGFQEEEFLKEFDISGLRQYLTLNLECLIKELPPAKDPK